MKPASNARALLAGLAVAVGCTAVGTLVCFGVDGSGLVTGVFEPLIYSTQYPVLVVFGICLIYSIPAYLLALATYEKLRARRGSRDKNARTPAEWARATAERFLRWVTGRPRQWWWLLGLCFGVSYIGFQIILTICERPPANSAYWRFTAWVEQLLGRFPAQLVIPLGLLAPPFVVAFLVFTTLYRRHLHDPDNLRCLKCGHILRGLTEPRCPECGERI